MLVNPHAKDMLGLRWLYFLLAVFLLVAFEAVLFSAVVFLAVAALAATVLVVAVFSAVFLAALVLSLVTLARLLALAVAVFFAATGVLPSLDAPLVAVEALRGLTVLLLIPGSALGLLLLASVDLVLAAFGLLVALAFLATGLDAPKRRRTGLSPHMSSSV